MFRHLKFLRRCLLLFHHHELVNLVLEAKNNPDAVSFAFQTFFSQNERVRNKNLTDLLAETQAELKNSRIQIDKLNSRLFKKKKGKSIDLH